MSDQGDRLSDHDHNLDNIFGSDTESEVSIKSGNLEQNEQQDASDHEMDVEEEDEEAERRKVLNAAIFGDDESEEEEDERMKDTEPVQKKRSKNILGKKEVTLDPSVNISRLKPYMFKLPGFISVEGEEFSVESLVNEELILLEADEEGNYPTDGLLRLSVSMRWRRNLMTDEIESNSRLIKWSDGSFTLRIGDEQFDVMNQNIQKEHAYLYNRHAKDGCMEGVAKLSERLAVRPFITGDASHRQFLSLNTASVPSNLVGKEAAKVKIAVTTADPEREKQRMIKLEQEKIKSRRKVEARRRNLQQKSYERVSRTGLSARFLEEEEVINGDDEDRYEVDFIDDTENANRADEVEYDSEEDTDFKSGDEDDDEGVSEEESEVSDDESTAQESEDDHERSPKKRSPSMKNSSSSRKAAKIFDSDEE